MTLGSLKDV